MSNEVLRLDVGCGGRGTGRVGFVGVDKCDTPDTLKQLYVQLDFVYDPLPWPADSVSEIVCSHMIEHLSPDEGVVLFSRFWWLLAPGGMATVTCPDLRKLARHYLAGDKAFWTQHYENGREIWPGRTLADRFNWAISKDMHQWCYDQALLLAVASQVGAEAKALPEALLLPNRADHETGIVIWKP